MEPGFCSDRPLGWATNYGNSKVFVQRFSFKWGLLLYFTQEIQLRVVEFVPHPASQLANWQMESVNFCYCWGAEDKFNIIRAVYLTFQITAHTCSRQIIGLQIHMHI